MDNPGYYAIIPATVRYDDRLTPNAKLLYGEITALSNKEGYCWAGNAYFANLYGVTKTSISTWIGTQVFLYTLPKNSYIPIQDMFSTLLVLHLK